MGQRRDRVEGQVAPELDPDVVPDGGADRRAQSGFDQLLRQRLDPLRARAVRFAQAVGIALDVLAHARLDDLGGLIDDAADRAPGADPVPLRPAWIDAPDVTELGRASCRERVCQYVYIAVGAVVLK